MSRTTCIDHAPDQQLVIIRQDYLAVCAGDHCAAALLNVFEYWTNIKISSNKQAEIENEITAREGDTPTQDTELWIYKRIPDFQAELLGLFGERKIATALQTLNTLGFISTRTNPRHKWDKTLQYLLNIDVLNSVIRSGKKEVSKAPKRGVKAYKNATALPETTLEVTSKGKEERKRVPTSQAPKPGTKDYLLAQYTPTHLSIADGILKQYTPDSYGMFSGAVEYLSTKTNPELERILDVVDSLSKKPTFVLDKLPKFFQYIKQDYHRRGLTVGISTFATQWDEWASKQRRAAQVIETVVAIPILEQALLDRAAREQQDNQS